MRILIDFRGSGYVDIYTEEGETLADMDKLSDKELTDRITDFSELIHLIDDDNIEVDGIAED